MMEKLGSTVLLDPAPSSKDETTTSSLYVIDGIDVVPEEDVWQIEVTKNVRERNSISGPKTGISCDCEPRGSRCFQDHERLRRKDG